MVSQNTIEGLKSLMLDLWAIRVIDNDVWKKIMDYIEGIEDASKREK